MDKNTKKVKPSGFDLDDDIFGVLGGSFAKVETTDTPQSPEKPQPAKPVDHPAVTQPKPAETAANNPLQTVQPSLQKPATVVRQEPQATLVTNASQGTTRPPVTATRETQPHPAEPVSQPMAVKDTQAQDPQLTATQKAPQPATQAIPEPKRELPRDTIDDDADDIPVINELILTKRTKEARLAIRITAGEREYINNYFQSKGYRTTTGIKLALRYLQDQERAGVVDLSTLEFSYDEKALTLMRTQDEYVSVNLRFSTKEKMMIQQYFKKRGFTVSTGIKLAVNYMQNQERQNKLEVEDLDNLIL